MTEYPNPDYYFKVEYGKLEMSFLEINGLDATSNGMKASNIELMKGLCPNNSLFESLILSKFTRGLDKKIHVKTLKITLMNTNREAIRIWECKDSYPITCKISNYETESGYCVIDRLIFVYTYLTRKL